MKRLAATLTLLTAMSLSANAAILIHSYTFTGNVNDGTGAENGTSFGDANVSGGVLNLDGTGDYVEFGTGLIPSSGSFSVLITARVSVPPPFGFMDAISQGSSGNAFYIGTVGVSGMRIGDTWGAPAVTYPTDGDWHVIAVTRDTGSGDTSLYIDGVLEDFTSAAFSNPFNSETRFGRQYGPHSEYWNGQLDDILIYDGALNASEVLALSTSVPEPWTMSLTAAGLVAVLLRYRARSKRHEIG
jgi:hypothetical protein